MWPIYIHMYVRYILFPNTRDENNGIKVSEPGASLACDRYSHEISQISHRNHSHWLRPSAWKCNRKSAIPEREAQSCSSADGSWHCYWNGSSSLRGLRGRSLSQALAVCGAWGCWLPLQSKGYAQLPADVSGWKSHCANKTKAYAPCCTTNASLAQLGICSMGVTWTLNTSQDVLPDVFQKHLLLPVLKHAPFCWSVPVREPRAFLCHKHHSPALTGTGHSLSSEKHQMLPALAMSSRSRGQSEPGGAAAWQKPPLTEAE